jgi:hypothetical protein
VRPVIDELDRITENIKRTKAQMEATSVGSEEHKKYADDLRKSESRKASLESEKKRITGKAGE